MGLPWPLVGRADELRRVRESLVKRHAGVLFAGPPGVGKTRLAREAEASAKANGRRTAWVTASQAASRIPLGAFATVLAPTAVRATSTIRLVSQAVTALEDLPESRRALLCIDDAHLLDDVSAAVVHQLALRATVTLVVTVRASSPPDAITALWKDELLERVDVIGLSDEEMTDLLQAALDGQVETTSRNRLVAAADGNALLLRHLVEGEIAAGRLVDEQQRWYWRGGGLPERVVDLLGAQFSSLDDGEREVLDLLAIAEPLPLAALDDVVGREATQRAEASGLICMGSEYDANDVRLAHPLYSEVLRAEMRPLRARRLRTTLVDALGSTVSSEHWSLRRCVLALDSDAEVPAYELQTAAGAAMALLDEPLAERLCRAALLQSPTFDTRLRLGYSLIRQERRGEGGAILRSLAEDSSETELAVAMRPIAASLFWDDDDPERAQAVLDDTGAALRSGVALAAVDALRASFAAFLGRGNDAAALARRVLGTVDAAPADIAWASAGACMAAAVGGNPRQVDKWADRGWTAAVASDTERFLVLPLTNAAVLAYGLAGELDRASAAADRFSAAAERFSAAPSGLPSAQARAASLLFRGQIAAWHGDLPEAARLLEDAAFGFGDPPGAPTCWAVQCLTMAVTVHADRGDLDAARGAQHRLRRHNLSAMTIFHADAELADACVAAAEGSMADAINGALRAAKIAREHRWWAVEVEALHRCVRWGDPCGVARLNELVGEVGGPRVTLVARQAAALAGDDATALADVAEGWHAIGANVLAADAYAQAGSVRSAGNGPVDGSVPGADAVRARGLAARHDAYTPALALVLVSAEGAGRLTRREREVASLAASGLSNSEIAGRLSVSTRTVEGHLQQAYDKLGVHHRTDLETAWMPRHPLAPSAPVRSE